jgi:nucleoside-diphosphate-sugar epimerase
MAERVLVTGASGFVGRAILAPLAALGFEVHGVTRGAPPGPGWHQADLLDEAAARHLLRALRPDILIHAAWSVEHGRFWTAPENAAWLEASTALFAHAAEAGTRRILGIGSCAEYAAAAPGDSVPWPESRPIALATPYGQAKAALAARLAGLADRHGLSWAWARLFLLFGPGEPEARLVPSVMRALLAGREAACGSGRPVRDFAATRYVGRALACLAAARAEGPVNIGAGEGRPIREVVEMIGRLAGRPELIRLGALPDRPGEAPHMVADIGRLRREAGFTERHDLEAALARLLAAQRAG